MSITSTRITVLGIDVQVDFKDIKNLHIGVYPPMGRVRVAAPQRMDDDQVRLAVIQRLPWIRRQQDELRSARRQSVREMVGGESHYSWGVRRRLKVVERPGRPHVEIDGDRLVLYALPGTDDRGRQDLLDQWYREQLRRAVPPLIERWEAKIGVSVPWWGIRRMKTKWGSCNQETGRLWFNSELAKKHPASLEYVIVHEMTHLLERGHGPRFARLMDNCLPDWRSRRDDLDAEPLADELWT
ncbi:M48 family metallopeptidase [Streptomyces sp. NPDC048111]|uniref:M48 family metallopeptidase n=1 Tax=Streptomyces sp. NPDC048111 TaxID=3365500 RepID=UPI0037212E1C